MSISLRRVWKATRHALAPVVLCSVMHGQTASPPSVVQAVSAPPVAQPAAEAAPASLAALHLAQLPDSTTPLSSATVSQSQPVHLLVGRSIFIATLSRLKRV